MTRQQYERWRDFALRMARTCYATARRPDAKWIVDMVEDFFDRFEEADIPCIVSWDNSSPYPEGNPCRSREARTSWCGCDGYRLANEDHPNPECDECHGSGVHNALVSPLGVGDMMIDFMCDYELEPPQCRLCSGDVEYEPELNIATGMYRVVGRKDCDAKFCDPGCDCPDGHHRRYDASRCQKWLAKRDAMCRCDDIRERFYEQWDEQWGGPVRCCVRAGLDCASAPSAGVVGFTAGDVRDMYPEGVPDWVFRPDEPLHYWLSGKVNGTFAELPDSMGVVL